MATLPSCSAPKRKGGKYCAAGGPSGVSCNNGQFTEGISMHKFPSEKNPRQRKLWLSFVLRHRPNYRATNSSYLCSLHFDSSCFTTNASISDTLGMKRFLVKDAVPTIDLAGKIAAQPKASTDRERRQVSWFRTGDPFVHCFNL